MEAVAEVSQRVTATANRLRKLPTRRTVGPKFLRTAMPTHSSTIDDTNTQHIQNKAALMPAVKEPRPGVPAASTCISTSTTKDTSDTDTFSTLSTQEQRCEQKHCKEQHSGQPTDSNETTVQRKKANVGQPRSGSFKSYKRRRGCPRNDQSAGAPKSKIALLMEQDPDLGVRFPIKLLTPAERKLKLVIGNRISARRSRAKQKRIKAKNDADAVRLAHQNELLRKSNESLQQQLYDLLILKAQQVSGTTNGLGTSLCRGKGYHPEQQKVAAAQNRDGNDNDNDSNDDLDRKPAALAVVGVRSVRKGHSPATVMAGSCHNSQNQTKHKQTTMVLAQPASCQVPLAAKIPSTNNDATVAPFRSFVTAPSVACRQPDVDGRAMYTHHNNTPMQHVPFGLSTSTIAASPTHAVGVTDASTRTAVLDDIILQHALHTYASSIQHNPLLLQQQYHPYQQHNQNVPIHTSDVARLLSSNVTTMLPSNTRPASITSWFPAPQQTYGLPIDTALHHNDDHPPLSGTATTQSLFDNQRSLALAQDGLHNSGPINPQVSFNTAEVAATHELLHLARRKGG